MREFQFLPRTQCIGLGSTDARRIAAGDWTSLYDEKTGAVAPVNLHWVWKPRLGLATEALHAEWHGAKHCDGVTHDPPLLEPELGPDGKSLAIVGEVILLQDLGGPYAGGRFFTSLDRWVVEDDCPLEMKHTHGDNHLRQAAEFYMAQLQHQLFVTGRSRLRFSIIRGNDEPEWGYVARDQAYIDRLLKMEVAFWQAVVTGDRPAPIEPDATLKDLAAQVPINGYRPYDFGAADRQHKGANEFIAKAADYVALKAKADQFKEVDRDLRKLIPADASQVRGGGLVFKRDARGAYRCSIEAEAAAA